MSQTSHWNAQQPDNQVMAPTPQAHYFVGDFACEVESVIPFRVIGCDTGCIQIVFAGQPFIVHCQIMQPKTRALIYTDPDCQTFGCPQTTEYIPVEDFVNKEKV